MDIIALLPSLLLLALAAATQGFLGFGFGIVAMTTLAFLDQQPLQHLAGVVNLTGLLVAGGGLWQWRRAVLWRSVLRFLPGILLGVLLGVSALGGLPADFLLRALGLVVLLLAVWNLLRGRGATHPAHPVDRADAADPVGSADATDSFDRPERLPEASHPTQPVDRAGPLPEASSRAALLDGLVGFAAGVLGGAFNTGGPPLVAHLYRRPESPDALRGTIQALFLSISLCRAPVAWGHGMMSAEVLWHAACALPLVAIGLRVGATLGRRLPAWQFRRTAWYALGLLGFVLMIRQSG